ncbi:hypothetical protein Peur_024116 [Populus x canadensis]
MPPAAPDVVTLRSGLHSVDEYDQQTRCLLEVHGLNAVQDDLNIAALILLMLMKNGHVSLRYCLQLSEEV